MVFSLKNEVGCLVKALRLFQVSRCAFFLRSSPLPRVLLHPRSSPQEKRVNLRHIESRLSRRRTDEVEIFADCSCSPKEFNELLEHLKDHVNIISFNTPAQVWSAEAGRTAHVMLVPLHLFSRVTCIYLKRSETEFKNHLCHVHVHVPPAPCGVERNDGICVR